MSEIIVESTVSETVIAVEGGPLLTTTVSQEFQTVIETPSEPVVIDLNSGARGEPGSAILTGPAYPNLTMGTVGDIYIVTEGDIASGFVFTKAVEGWIQSGSVRGPAGGINTINGYGGPDVELAPIDIGLERVNNTNDLEKPVSTATQVALDALGVADDELLDEINTKEDILVAGTVSQYYRGDKTWALLNSTAVGLANVDNTSDTNKPISTATQAALDLKATIEDMNLKAPIESPTFTGTVGGITKGMVGLGNVDNTSDVNKPVSTAQQAALDTKVNLAGSETISGTKTFTASPIVPAPTDATHASTRQYVDDRVNAILDSSPETLNTLNELAEALGDDPNFATTMTNELATKVSLDGDQSIQGVKTFVSAPVVPDASFGIIKIAGLQSALDLKAPLASPTFSGTITGNGSGLTALNGTQVTTGTVADARLSSNVALKNATNAFTGTVTVPTPTASTQAANKDYVDSTTVDRTTAQTIGGAKTFTSRTVISSTDTGTTYSSAPLEVRTTDTGVPRISFHKATVNAAQIRMTDAGVFEFANIGDTAYSAIAAHNITSTGTIYGNGSGITSLDASNVTSGTLPADRLPAEGKALAAYPVGSVYISINNVNPSTLFGGTWTAFAGGRTLVGVTSSDTDFNASQKASGAKTVTLTAAQSGSPAHTHPIYDPGHYHNTSGRGTTWAANNPWGTTDIYFQVTAWGGDGANANNWLIMGSSWYNTNTRYTGIGVSNSTATNATASHENMPPYITVYMWLRTA